MNSTLRLIILLLTGMAVVLTGCGSKPEGEQPESSSGSADPKAAEIRVFYSDTNLEGLLEQSKAISYTSEIEKYTESVYALTASDDPDFAPLWVELTLLSVNFADGRLTLDMSIGEGGRWGAPGEQLALEALKQTLFQFEEVDQIEILLDGRQTDSLMGHMDLPHPIERQEQE